MKKKRLKRSVKSTGVKKVAKRKMRVKSVHKKRFDLGEESGFISLLKMFTAPVK
jgi:hypothetical protein